MLDFAQFKAMQDQFKEEDRLKREGSLHASGSISNREMTRSTSGSGTVTTEPKVTRGMNLSVSNKEPEVGGVMLRDQAKKNGFATMRHNLKRLSFFGDKDKLAAFERAEKDKEDKRGSFVRSPSTGQVNGLNSDLPKTPSPRPLQNSHSRENITKSDEQTTTATPNIVVNSPGEQNGKKNRSSKGSSIKSKHLNKLKLNDL